MNNVLAGVITSFLSSWGMKIPPPYEQYFDCGKNISFIFMRGQNLPPPLNNLLNGVAASTLSSWWCWWWWWWWMIMMNDYDFEYDYDYCCYDDEADVDVDVDDDDDADDDDDDDEWCAFRHSTFGELQKKCNPSTIQARSNVRVAPNNFKYAKVNSHPSRHNGARRLPSWPEEHWRAIVVAFGSWAHVLLFDFNKMEQILNLKSLIDFCVLYSIYICISSHVKIVWLQRLLSTTNTSWSQRNRANRCKQVTRALGYFLWLLCCCHTRNKGTSSNSTDLAGIDARKVSDTSCSWDSPFKHSEHPKTKLIKIAFW